MVLPMSSQYNGHAQIASILDHGPEIPPRRWIHARRRLVQKDNTRPAYESDRRAHFALVASAQVLHKLVVELI